MVDLFKDCQSFKYPWVQLNLFQHGTLTPANLISNIHFVVEIKQIDLVRLLTSPKIGCCQGNCADRALVHRESLGDEAREWNSQTCDDGLLFHRCLLKDCWHLTRVQHWPPHIQGGKPKNVMVFVKRELFRLAPWAIYHSQSCHTRPS